RRLDGGARRALSRAHVATRPTPLAGRDAGRLQPVHDHRLVLALEVQGPAAADRGADQLGHRLLRVLAGGPRQPHGLGRLFGAAAEGDPGGGDADGLRRLLGALPGPEDRVEPGDRLCADRRRGLLRLPLARRDLTGMAVPRIIHQLWKDAAIPERYWALCESWRRHHPDWEHKLWTDADLARLVDLRFPQLKSLYDGYARGISRADLVRYLVMAVYGGVYADLDCECLKPVGPLVEGDQVVFGLEPA